MAFAESRAAAGATFEVEGRFHVNEGQRHELREAASALLQVAHANQVAGPVLGLVDVAVHDGGGGAKAHVCAGFHHGEPLFGVDLVWADHGAHFVVEDLGGGAWQGCRGRNP